MPDPTPTPAELRERVARAAWPVAFQCPPDANRRMQQAHRDYVEAAYEKADAILAEIGKTHAIVPREGIPKHRARALQAIAHDRCVTDLTDGFCRPRDGQCARSSARPRRCHSQAESAIRSLESVGCQVVWMFDPALGKRAEEKVA